MELPGTRRSRQVMHDVRPPHPTAPPLSPSLAGGLNRPQRRLIPWVLCAAAGLLIALWPHAVRWWDTGSPVYMSDPDELVGYLPYVSHAYHNHPWKIGDPALPSGGRSLIPVIQSVPFILVARLLDAGPVTVLLLWRLWAGLAWGIALYALTRPVVPTTRYAVAIVLFLLASQGTYSGDLLWHHLKAFLDVTRGGGGIHLDGWTTITRHFRLITPGVSGPFLIAFLWSVNRAAERQGKSWLWPGAILGLLFYVYFYFWTAAAACLGLLMLLDRRRWRFWLSALGLGLLLGVPWLLLGQAIRASAADGWLERLDFLRQVPRMSGPAASPLVFGGTMVAAVAAFWRHRVLLPAVALLACALVLSNHHLVTGLEMQNFHWFYASGPVLSWLLAVWICREAAHFSPGRTGSSWLAVGIAAAMVASALVLRTWHTRNNVPATTLSNTALALLREPLPGIEPNAVIAGEPEVVDAAVATGPVRALAGGLATSHSVSNAEWEQRRLLDLLASGHDAASAAEQVNRYTYTHLQFLRLSPADRERERERMHSLASGLAADLPGALAAYGVRHIVLPRSASLPAALAGEWTALPATARWQVWERGNGGRTNNGQGEPPDR